MNTQTATKAPARTILAAIQQTNSAAYQRHPRPVSFVAGATVDDHGQTIDLAGRIGYIVNRYAGFTYIAWTVRPDGLPAVAPFFRHEYELVRR